MIYFSVIAGTSVYYASCSVKCLEVIERFGGKKRRKKKKKIERKDDAMNHKRQDLGVSLQ